MTYTSFDDFSDADGKIDWSAYNAHRVEAGETCHVCGGHIVFPKGHRDSCSACNRLESEPDRESDHDRFFRCPACGNLDDAADWLSDGASSHMEGEHTMSCQACDHDYEVSVAVSYTFHSPARLAQADSP